MPPPRLALVACVRDEAAWLPAFLHYHHAIGVERGYVFLDRCTDASARIAHSFPWVHVQQLEPGEARQFPYICDLHGACMNAALRRARHEGFDWLLTLDPDEFACADHQDAASALARAHLPRLLEQVKPETVQVRLATRELAPMRSGGDIPFWRQRFFQRTPGLVWDIFDPLTGRRCTWRDFLGHRQGKSIIRTAADVQAYDSHRWVPEQGVRWPERPQFVELPTEELGYHAHYFVAGARHWLEKFPKQTFEPATWFCGKEVELPKQCWKRLAGRLTQTERAGYFERWIARDEDELRRRAAAGTLVEDSVVCDVLSALGVLRGDEATVPACAGAGRAAPTFFPHADAGPAAATGPVLSYPAARLAAAARRGFHALERSGVHFFRWTEPHAALRLCVRRGDYRLRIDMKHLSHLWAGRIAVRLNERAVSSAVHVEAGVVSLGLRREDFPASDEVWLHLDFDPADLSNMAGEHRRLGAPVFGIELEPLGSRLWRRAVRLVRRLRGLDPEGVDQRSGSAGASRPATASGGTP